MAVPRPCHPRHHAGPAGRCEPALRDCIAERYRGPSKLARD